MAGVGRRRQGGRAEVGCQARGWGGQGLTRGAGAPAALRLRRAGGPLGRTSRVVEPHGGALPSSRAALWVCCRPGPGGRGFAWCGERTLRPLAARRCRGSRASAAQHRGPADDITKVAVYVLSQGRGQLASRALGASDLLQPWERCDVACVGTNTNDITHGVLKLAQRQPNKCSATSAVGLHGRLCLIAPALQWCCIAPAAAALEVAIQTVHFIRHRPHLGNPA
jgi:hypothetical protein